MRALAIAAVALTACTAAPEQAAPVGEARAPRDDRALGEPISMRMGGRQVSVRCALACEPARDQLGRLRDRCVADPMSTPHHIETAPARIALACCAEAAAAYEEACGEPSLAGCVSRWSAECESRRIE